MGFLRMNDLEDLVRDLVRILAETVMQKTLRPVVFFKFRAK